MGDRASLIWERKPGDWALGYVHNAGRPTVLGQCLEEAYSNPHKCEQLFDLMPASGLGDELTPCGDAEDECNGSSFYARDWKREDEQEQGPYFGSYANLDSALANLPGDVNHIYVGRTMNRRVIWKVAVDENGIPVSTWEHRHGGIGVGIEEVVRGFMPMSEAIRQRERLEQQWRAEAAAEKRAREGQNY